RDARRGRRLWTSVLLSAGVHVASGRLCQRLVAARAEALGGGLELAGARGEPPVVVGPPASRLRGGALGPCLGRWRVLVGDPVARAALRRWRVDQRLDVAAGGEHEARRAAEQLGAAIGVLPRNDVVGQPRDDVAVQ